jgi:hypothetical protein
VHNVSDVRQIEVHTAEPLVPGPSCLEVKIAVAKLRKYKSPGIHQIPAELIQAGGEILLSAIHKLVNSVWNKGELPDEWKESIIVPVNKKGDKIDCNNYPGISLLLTSYKILWNILLTNYMLLSCYQNVGQNWDITIANRSFENVSQFKYLGTTVTNQNLIQVEMKRRLNSVNACYHSVQNLLSSHLWSKNLKI